MRLGNKLTLAFDCDMNPTLLKNGGQVAATVISPVNRKGGVGKSSSVFHLGGYFAAHGKKVLLIDNEPQHSLTNGIIGPDAADALDPRITSAALFDAENVATPASLIQETHLENIHLVYGSDALDRFNGPPEQEPIETQLVIKDFVDQVKDRYDFVLIDNPPNLQICTYSSLAASNFTYCITMPQEFDVQGLVPVQRAIDRVLRTTNPTLRLAGYVLNKVQSRRSLHDLYEELLRDTYGKKVVNAILPDWNDFAESLTARQPVSMYRPSSLAAKRIELLAKELMSRMDDLHRRPPEFQNSGRRGSSVNSPYKQPEEAA